LAKRKAPKERVSLSAESEGAPRPPPRKLLKKFDQNFIQLTKAGGFANSLKNGNLQAGCRFEYGFFS